MKISLRHESRLETESQSEIASVLDYKLENTSPEGVTDYVALTISNLDDKIKKISQAEKDIKALKQDIQNQQKIIKIETAKWLEEAGVTKLNGLYTSSVSISKPKPREELIIVNEDALINAGYFKAVLDKTAVKKAINEGVQIEGAYIDLIFDEDIIRINKKKEHK